MCLIGFALNAHPRFALIIAGNRDETYARPTEPAGWWPPGEAVYGGRDAQAGGSWMALTRDGRLAAVTNYRERAGAPAVPSLPLPVVGRPSRGALVGGFVEPAIDADDDRERFITGYRRRVVDEGAVYAGFNLLLFAWSDGRPRAWWLSNREPSCVSRGGKVAGVAVVDRAVGDGVHALSNALLDTPWPKSQRLIDALERCVRIDDAAQIADTLFEALADRRPPPDARLPDTGVGLARERALAPPFISTPGYGTRSSTLILVDRAAHVDYVERSFPNDGPVSHRHARFRLRVGAGRGGFGAGESSARLGGA